MESEVKSSLFARKSGNRIIECEVSSIGDQISFLKLNGVLAFAPHKAFIGSFEVEVADHIVSLDDSSVFHAVMIALLIGDLSSSKALNGL